MRKVILGRGLMVEVVVVPFPVLYVDGDVENLRSLVSLGIDQHHRPTAGVIKEGLKDQIPLLN